MAIGRLSEDPTAPEFRFEADPAGGPAAREGTAAIGARIQNLLLMIPGTNPEDPEMGIGIQRWQFRNTEKSLGEISSEASRQISRYLPDIVTDGVQAMVVKKGTPMETLVFKVSVSDSSLRLSENLFVGVRKVGEEYVTNFQIGL